MTYCKNYGRLLYLLVYLILLYECSGRVRVRSPFTSSKIQPDSCWILTATALIFNPDRPGAKACQTCLAWRRCRQERWCAVERICVVCGMVDILDAVLCITDVL